MVYFMLIYESPINLITFCSLFVAQAEGRQGERE